MKTAILGVLAVLMFMWGCLKIEVGYDHKNESKAFWFDVGTGLLWLLLTAPTIIRLGIFISNHIFNLG